MLQALPKNTPPASLVATVSRAPGLAPLRIGMLGLGTVGAGSYRVLTRNQSAISARSGRALQLVGVAVRDMARARGIVGNTVALSTDPHALVAQPDIEVVVEAMGGTTLARELVLRAIAHGKHVVTANKALLAEHGAEIFAAAERQGLIVAYEGAVAVSIPIIKALRESLVANRIEWVAGIVNGTSNFILSQMREQGLDFASALQDAQRRGYAEADPRFDVDGIDAAHKISLLASNAFGTPIVFEQVPTEGIAHIEAVDMAYAEQLGFRIKLLAVAARHADGIDLGVQPALLPAGHLLASVNGSMNAVMVKGDASGITLYYGAGAGAEQTASAVIADLVDVARTAHARPAERVPHLAFQPSAMQALPQCAPRNSRHAWYLRVACDGTVRTEQALLRTLRRAGVQARIHGRYAQPEQGAHHVVLTQALEAPALQQALAQLARLPGLRAKVIALRVAQLD